MIIALAIILLVLVHEAGHFWVARRNGITVREFGFGFPPRIFGRRRGGTLYSVNLLPLGGFVRLKGEDGDNGEPDSLAAANFSAKAKVFLAGVAINAVVAFLLLLGLALTDLPTAFPGQYNPASGRTNHRAEVIAVEVGTDSPAAQSGIMKGDAIISAEGTIFKTESELKDFTKAHAGQVVVFQYRAGTRLTEAPVVLRKPDSKDGFLGVTPIAVEHNRYGWSAPVVAARVSGQLVVLTLKALGGLITGLVARQHVPAEVSSVVGAVAASSALSTLGWAFLVMVVAQISLTLAVINCLPLPPLDGGRLAVAALRRGGLKIPTQTEAVVNTVAFGLLIVLSIILVAADLKRIHG